MIILSKRQNNILFYLLSLNNKITIEAISKKFDISPRTVRNDLYVLEDFLSGYEVNIVKKPKEGIFIKGDKNNILKLRNDLNLIDYRLLDFEERSKVISLLLLCNEIITFDKLANICLVSKQTIITTFKSVDRLFIENDVEIIKYQGKGIFIKGKEEKIRNLYEKIIELTCKNTLIINLVVKNSSLNKYDKQAMELINKIETRGQTTIQDKTKLKLLLSFILYRINSNQKLNPKTSDAIFPEYFDLDEIKYCNDLVKRLNKESENSGEEALIAEDLITKLQNIQKLDDESNEYYFKGLTNHLKATLYRLRNNIIIENELLSQIKINIPLIYEFTKRELKQWENKLNLVFSENEIAYISMYLASAYEKSIKLENKINVIIVCQFGLATSTILKTRILNVIPECNLIGPMGNVEAINYIKNNPVDLAICTKDCFLKDVNMITVNPLIDTNDIELIKTKLFQISYSLMCENFISGYSGKQKKTYIKDLVELDNIQIIDKIDDFEKAIELAAQPLLIKKAIEKRYVAKMIEAVNEFGTYMVLLPETAFVHAGINDGINQDCTSVLVLKKPVVFGYKNPKEVRNIVILGVKTKQDNPLIDLIYIFENEENLKKLKSEDIDIIDIYNMHN